MSINSHKTSCTRKMYLIKKEKKKIRNILTTSLKKNNNTPFNKMIPKTNSPPKSDYSHIQNYSPFLSRVTKGRVSSRHLIGRASTSIIIWSVIVINIIIIIILGIGSTCRRVIRPTRTFTLYNSVESVSRWASMRCSYVMMSLIDTLPKKEGADADGVDRDGAEWVEGVAESVYRDRNWASLRLTVV